MRPHFLPRLGDTPLECSHWNAEHERDLLVIVRAIRLRGVRAIRLRGVGALRPNPKQNREVKAMWSGGQPRDSATPSMAMRMVIWIPMIQ
jgi:hypothetical protein